MRLRTILVVTVSLLMAADQGPQKRSGKEGLRNTIIGQERKVWDAFKKGDAATIKRLYSDDYVEPLSSGTRLTKKVLLKELANITLSDYSLDEIAVIPLSKDVALITYRAMQKGTFGGTTLPSPVQGSTVWVNRGGHWLLAFHQETLLEKK
jgi:hypothetical protein